MKSLWKRPCARYSVKLRTKLISCVGTAAAALLLTLNATAGTFTVATTADSGSGSLRQAILDANATPGADTITFAIGDSGSQQTIQPASALPTISDPLTIDGWSQGGGSYAGPPLIEINGGLAGSSVSGLTITAGNSVVRGLVINGFIGSFASGIRLQTGGNNWVYGNYIGVNFAGDTRRANQRGIWIDNGSGNNRIGTNADGINDAAERNVISANVEQNIWIYQPTTTGNKIMGNYIGLNAAGTAAAGTNNQTVAAAGILVQEASSTIIGTDGDGQGDALEGNVISGSILNINLTGTIDLNESHHNRISGNRIGTNADGTAGVGIQAEGVRVNVAYDNLIGTDGDGVSDELEGNLISSHIDFGVMLQQIGARNNVVAGNKIGTDLTGMFAIPNGTGSSPRAGILLGGYGNRIGTDSDGVSDELERNLISGNAKVSVYAIYFNNLPKPDAPPTIIAGNWMGVNATGLAALPNNVGIGNVSYTPVIIRDNVISGHTYEGISTPSSGLLIIGNRIGVGADGVTPLGNGQHGLFLSGNNNIIGGTGPGEANIIAHNGATPYYSGVRVGNTGLGNTIRGNRIYANSQLGIDLRWPDGVNINDPGDADTGGNNLQNFPVITFAQAYNNGTTIIQGTLNSHPNTLFTLDFYYNSSPDPTSHGEGEFYLGEAQVMTDASSNAVFEVTLPVTLPPNQFVTATATHPDGGTSEFSIAYAAGGVVDVPIQGLTLQVQPPIYIGIPATFNVSVVAGTGVAYTWSFGDGQSGAGATVSHTYTNIGTYTVSVAASNNNGSAAASEEVVVLEPANFNGVVWVDRDADGFFGLGETSYNVLQHTFVTATLQGPPHTVVSSGRDIHGNYQILTSQAGIYRVEVTNSVVSFIPNFTTPNPVVVAMGADGGTELNFGIAPTGFVQQPDDDGYVTGRAWIDSNGNGYPDLNETPLNGRTVRLMDADHKEVTTHVTGTGPNWPHGLYGFRISTPGTYRVQMDAPPGVFPASREVEIYVADLRVVSAQLPFLPGGTIGGQVADGSGAGIDGVVMTLQPGNLQTTTSPGGGYGFSGLADGNYTLQITPPANYVTPDSVTQRFVPATINGSAVENWTLLRKGQLTVKAIQVVNGQPLPIDFMFFEVLLNESVVRTVYTGVNGEALVEGLTPGTYTVRPWDFILDFIAGMQFAPAERIAVVSHDTSATVSFTGTLERSLNIFARLPVAGNPGFACRYEVRNSNGSLVNYGYLPADQPDTSSWNVGPATLEVRMIPDPEVPGQEGWPTHTQVVVMLAEGAHANVYYPFNPANRQSLEGYAFQDHCVPIGIRGSGNNCNETGVPGNNGLTVTLYNAGGALVTNTQTTLGTSWNTGFYRFDELPVGEYRVAITLPHGYTPTTSTNVQRALDGFTAPEQVHFGYQRTETQTLTGRVYVDADGNGSYDPTWDDVLSGTPIAIRTLADTLIASMNTASDGSYTLVGIAPGEYRITMTRPDVQMTNTAQIPVVSSITTVDFPLAPPGATPRVLVFADANTNGLADPGEQRFGGVTVQLVQGPCDEPGTVLQTVVTSSDGLAIFTAPPPGDEPLCARITHGLPPNTVPKHLPGVVVPRGSGSPVPTPIVPSLKEPPLKVTDSINVRADTFSLIFRSASDRTYTVERTGDLSSWSSVSNATTYDFGYSQRVVIPLYTNVHQSFFRILEQR